MAAGELGIGGIPLHPIIPDLEFSSIGVELIGVELIFG
jgi:hypothetical protein